MLLTEQTETDKAEKGGPTSKQLFSIKGEMIVTQTRMVMMEKMTYGQTLDTNCWKSKGSAHRLGEKLNNKRVK